MFTLFVILILVFFLGSIFAGIKLILLPFRIVLWLLNAVFSVIANIFKLGARKPPTTESKAHAGDVQ